MRNTRTTEPGESPRRPERAPAPAFPLTFDGDKPEEEPGTGGTPDWEQRAKAAEAEAEKWKALSRKHEDRAKENADAAAKLRDLEERDKTEVQKLTTKEAEARQAAADADARAKKAELEVVRLRVAATKGLTPEQAARLTGDDEAAMAKDADDLIAAFKPSKPSTPTPGSKKPTPTLQPGTPDPEDEPEETDPAKLAAMIPRA